ncbi:hypothetical protein ACET3Z_029522 [Daucus carota]
MDKSGQEKVPEASVIDNAAGTGRSYECNFCKRGFTNAQALGGHMNIHRKEKAKASKKSLLFFGDQETSKCGDQANFTHQFNLAVPNPSQFPYVSLKNLGPNLSLDMGSWRSSKEDEVGRRDEKMENEVDLELRLGHDPNRPNN